MAPIKNTMTILCDLTPSILAGIRFRLLKETSVPLFQDVVTCLPIKIRDTTFRHQSSDCLFPPQQSAFSSYGYRWQPADMRGCCGYSQRSGTQETIIGQRHMWFVNPRDKIRFHRFIFENSSRNCPTFSPNNKLQGISCPPCIPVQAISTTF
jgi:hypothetical protein